MDAPPRRKCARAKEVGAPRARMAELEGLLGQRPQDGGVEPGPLDASSWLLSSLVQHAGDGLAVVRLDGNVIFINDAFARMHGYAPEELTGKHVSILHTSGQMASVNAANTVLRETGRFEGEIWHARRDGSVFPAQIRSSLLRDASRNIVGIIESARDITDVKAAERALQESEARFRVVAEGAPIGVYVCQAGRMLYVNSEFARVFGREPGEIIDLTDLMELVHPDDRAMAAEHIQRRLGGEVQSARYRFRGIRKDGAVVRCEACGRSASYEGRPSIIGVLADVTDRAESEALRERLAQAMENSSEGIGIWDERWCLTYCNAAMTRILGVARREDVAARNWLPLLDGGASMPHHRIAGLVEREGAWSGRLFVKRPDGTRVPLAVTFTHFVATTGDRMIVGSIRDTSTEESYLAQIRKLTADAERSLEAEKARISRELHDELGQLLTVLNLDLAWVGRRLEGAAASVAERVVQMQDITRQVTERVRHLSKRLHPPALVHEGLAAVIRSLGSEFEQRTGIACRVTLDPGELSVREPLATTVFRIVQEALTNVARHAQAGRCEVSLELRRDTLEVTVRDYGVGAAPEVLAGKKSLGIVGMRERAAAAGGTLSVDSEPGGGVCVTARLPSRRRPRKPRKP